MKEAIEIFTQVTRYDLMSYFDSFLKFIENDNPILISYYDGETEIVPSESLIKLDNLIKENKNIQYLLVENKHQFNNSLFWELTESIDNILIKLITISKYAKWFRSSLSKAGYIQNVEVNYILKQNQTLESLSNEIGYSDPENDWIDLALKNDLTEEEYDSTGGILFKFSWQNDFRFELQSVVDNISGENVYGKDLDKKLQFIDNDLKVLPPKETINQSVNILINLLKGDIPEFPNDGIDKSMISKLNKNFNVYPSLFRQIYNTFSKDDTLKSISIINISEIEDSIRIELSIETRLNEVITTTI